MAKKVKKKVKSGQKDKRGPSISHKEVAQLETSNAETPDNGVVAVIDRGLCSHIDRGINKDKLATKLGSSESLRCEDCREHAVDSRARKGKGKHGKKGGKSESKAIWICLECGHFACGGLGLPTTPQSHAVRHAKQNHHPLVVHYENHQLVWCFSCSKLIPAEKSEDNKQKEVLKEVLKMLKAQPGEVSKVDVEDVWFGSGSVTIAIKSGHCENIGPDGRVGYSIRGLSNLGNTCFFNSIMQNLLAINSLREYLFKLEESVGPLIAALKKLFLETNTQAGIKSVINPRSLFGSLCTKAPQFRGYQQHDSHELLRCLLDGLSTEELTARKHAESSEVSITDPTFVDVIFGGQLSSTVSCLECGHSSTIYEPFLDLSLPVPTKKPPPRKIQPVTRGKKQKLPPRRSGRNISKISRESNNLHGERVSAQSSGDNSLGEQKSVPQQPEQQLALASGDYPLSDSTDQNAMALDMGFTVDDLSAVQKPQNQQAVENIGEQSISSDSFSWLDYLGQNPISSDNNLAAETDAIPATQSLANEDVLENDVSLSVTLDSMDESNLATALSATSLDSAENLNAFGPHQLTPEQDAFSSFEDKPNEKPESEVIADISHNSESCNQVFSKDIITLEREDENPLLVQDSEVILLPSKEDASSSVEVSKAELVVSSSVLGDEQDSSDFVGFGDLFNEPEVFVEPKPSDHLASTKNGVTGNSSESDPDEVDNADAPVSVESCLTLFTKPELLSKDEHAWLCDNCSKVLREQRIRLRSKLQLPKSEFAPNGCEDRNPSRLLDVEKTRNEVKNMNGDLEKNVNDSSEYLSFSNQDVNGECDSEKNGFAESDLMSAECDSELTEEEEVKSEKLKVKRDATKTILIRKAPPVLTIQLKRFSQDTRGRLSKLNGHVNFRETIDLKPYMDPSTCSNRETLTYRLVGLVEHLGSMRGGHYVAYVRGRSKDYGDCVWYHASDAYVRQASLDEVLRCQAYILFYERT